MAYVYKHTRNDNNQSFYIGIGSDSKYKRAYTKNSRNNHWLHIVKNCEYKVDILFTDISWEDACIIEKQLIKEIGRRDLGLGSLVNMTDGGDGTLNRIHSENTRKKMSDSCIGKYSGAKNPMYGKTGENSPHFGKKYSQDRKRKMGEARKLGKHPLAKIVLDTQTGIYYTCAKEVSDIFKIKYTRLRDYLSGRSKNKTNFIYA